MRKRMFRNKEHHKPRCFPIRGQSLIEMALMLPFLLILIMGGLDFGRLFFAKTIVTNAAREGAYYLSLHPQDFNADTGSAPNTVLAAEMEASNSGIPEIIVTIEDSEISTDATEEEEEEETGGWWGGGGWGGWDGWGWEGGCVCEEDTAHLGSVRVTVQANVNNVLFLSMVGNIFSLNATSYDTFPVSSCVEMIIP